MCGRFTLTAELGQLEDRFAFQAAELTYSPSYNIAPSQSVLAVIGEEQNRAGYLRWGLVPAWAKGPEMGRRLINARSESAADKPSFRTAFRRRRCLILADGFYEWRRTGKIKQPLYIRLQSRQPFAFAGLWEVWRDATKTPLYTCTILTTAANTLMQPIHERMPVILDPAAEAAWLDPHLTSPPDLLPLLQPYAPEVMEAFAVSSQVNSPRYNTPACLVPVAATSTEA